MIPFSMSCFVLYARLTSTRTLNVRWVSMCAIIAYFFALCYIAHPRVFLG